MNLATKDWGFWKSIGSLSIRQVAAWDFVLALAAGVAVPLLAASHLPEPANHVDIAGDLLLVSAALFGLVLAGFAIVAALLGDRYSRLLEASGASALDLLRHFIIVGGILVCAIVAAVAFRAFAAAVHSWEPDIELAALGVTVFLSAWGLFGVLELMKLILGVAITNTAMRSIEGGTSGRRSG